MVSNKITKIRKLVIDLSLLRGRTIKETHRIRKIKERRCLSLEMIS